MSDTAFTGSIPQVYDRFMGPALFAPYARDLVRRFAGFEGELLEVAAGTGIVTEALDAALPPAAQIIATDLNSAMLDHAARKFVSPRVTWQPADGEALPFEDLTFDAVVCQFGVMFFPDKRQGFREARRVLRPGGRYVFSVWDRLEANPDSRITHETVAALFPADPPAFFARMPFGYADPQRIRGDLWAAGFGDAAIETVRLQARVASARDMALGLCQGTPLAGEILARAPEALDRVTDTVAAALTQAFGDGPYVVDRQALVVTVTR